MSLAVNMESLDSNPRQLGREYITTQRELQFSKINLYVIYVTWSVANLGLCYQ